MARTLLTQVPTDNVGTDDGNQLLSFTQSEARNIDVSISGAEFADLSGFTITATARPAATGSTGNPNGFATGATDQTLAIIDATTTDNAFAIRFDADALVTAHPDASSLAPGVPLYYFVSCTISTGTGNSLEAWEIVRGWVQLVDSVNT